MLVFVKGETFAVSPDWAMKQNNYHPVLLSEFIDKTPTALIKMEKDQSLLFEFKSESQMQAWFGLQ